MAKKKAAPKDKRERPPVLPTFQRTKDNGGNSAYVSHCRRFTIVQKTHEQEVEKDGKKKTSPVVLWHVNGGDGYDSAKKAKAACVAHVQAEIDEILAKDSQ